MTDREQNVLEKNIRMFDVVSLQEWRRAENIRQFNRAYNNLVKQEKKMIALRDECERQLKELKETQRRRGELRRMEEQLCKLPDNEEEDVEKHEKKDADEEETKNQAD
ncbi:hypothetical protein B9Z55_025345 [Caenorhabditis nigoni]|uniref:Uncharacterized protein n=2 Tax=Caenorhabditis nigoni TaxID=1611254 RepID=A0A2G5SY08_9PELO|nr:hypothetical protein B9Z55_025345 [Caenorhabditis nigoni]